MPKDRITISVVVFDIAFQSGSGITLAEVLDLVFARTPAQQLQKGSKARYQSGDYEKRGNIWTGRMELQRAARRATSHQDPERGYVFAEGGEEVTTAESMSIYAVNIRAQVIAYRERGWLPYTRLRSFVRRATRYHGRKMGQTFDLDVIPRKSERSIEEWIKFFAKIKSVSAEYQHSQSPGSKMADRVLEKLSADKAKLTYTARARKFLDKAEILNKELPLGIALDHIEKSDLNGSARIEGLVGNDTIIVDTADPVNRTKLETSTALEEQKTALSHAARDAPRTAIAAEKG